MANPLGPQITPKSPFGGGDARPPYLQMRRPTGPGVMPNYPGQMTQPVVTPKSTAMPGEVANRGLMGVSGTLAKSMPKPSMGPGGGPWGPGGPQYPGPAGGPKIHPN